MKYKKCACGCGKWVPVTRGGKKENKYYNKQHKQYHYYRLKIEGKPEAAEDEALILWEDMPASARWGIMTLGEVEAECYRLHLSYGQLQAMAVNGNLPADFGKGIEK